MLDFEPDGVAARPLAQFVLDRAQQVFRLFLVDVEITVARDPETVDLLDLESREQVVNMILDQILNEDVVPLVGLGVRDAHQPRQNARNRDHGMQGLVGPLGRFNRRKRLWLLFCNCGKGWLASTASGVRTGKTSSRK